MFLLLRIWSSFYHKSLSRKVPDPHHGNKMKTKTTVTNSLHTAPYELPGYKVLVNAPRALFRVEHEHGAY